MNIEEKISHFVNLFASLPTKEKKYEQLITWGKTLAELPQKYLCDANKIHACQSNTYFHTFLDNGKFRIQGSSDALISKGLVFLLIEIFDQQDPKSIVQTPSSLLEQIGLEGVLSPSRSNGFYHALLRIRQDALKALIDNQKNLLSEKPL
jgi:cysteine desulfuration protein SufE